MAALSIVPLADRDRSFVREMLYEAAFWRGTVDAPLIAEVLSLPGRAGSGGSPTMRTGSATSTS